MVLLLLLLTGGILRLLRECGVRMEEYRVDQEFEY